MNNISSTHFISRHYIFTYKGYVIKTYGEHMLQIHQTNVVFQNVEYIIFTNEKGHVNLNVEVFEIVASI